MRSLLLISAAVTLMGCLPDQITQAPITPTLTAKGAALTPTGSALLTLRAYEDVGKRVLRISERTAACTVANTTLSANLLTPAKILLPSFGLKTEPLRVICTLNDVTLTTSASCIFRNGTRNADVGDTSLTRCSYAPVTVIFNKGNGR